MRIGNFKSGNVLVVVDKPDNELIILQQPISHQHEVILRKIVEEVGVDLYVSSVVKCGCDKIKSEYAKKCSENLKQEIELSRPLGIVVCGKEPQKWFKRFFTEKYIELPSLHILLAGKTGIQRMKKTLRVIKGIYG